MVKMLLKMLGLQFCIFQVNCMTLKGPALTRYDPCGLGVVYFDKVTNMLWQGVINLGLYPSLREAEIEISFENSMAFYGVSQNSTLTVKNNWSKLILKPNGTLPLRYYLYVAVNGSANSTPVVNDFRINNVTLCNDNIKQSQRADSFNAISSDESLNHVCGRRSLDHAELTSVRTDSKAGDWPWHAVVLIKETNTDVAKYQCGGNIISRTAILTAAHCMFVNSFLLETNRIIIEAGVSNLIDKNQEGRQMLYAEKVILHPAYHEVHATADLAIIVVNKLHYTEYVQPICVWGPVYDKATLYGKRAVITGFGMTERNKLSNTLRSSYTTVQNDSTCIAFSPKLYLSLLNEFTFCAGDVPYTGINARNGDSGGGIAVSTIQPDHKITWFLRGVLSKCGVPAGQKLCDPHFYVVYTDVAPHYGWIYHNAGLNYISNIVQ